MEIDKVFNNDVDGVADNLFSAVKNSVSEIKAMQQRKAAENVQLVIQALKKIDSDIRSRYDHVGNALEKRVSSIKDGLDGSNGKDGRDGKDGKNGRDGAKGDKGERGQDGVNGVDGNDGVSVTNASIDFDGSLIITLSTGREINVGEVVAPDLAERIKVITNGGGTSQSVLDTLTSLQSQISSLIASQTGNSGKFLTTNGTTTSWSSTPTFTSITDSGNLTFTGTGNRITGDFSNATPANRVAFQTSTANSNTGLVVLPNGTATTTNIILYNNSDPANTSGLQMANLSTESTIRSLITGTGTYLPITFYTGGSERARIDASGNVGIGTSSPSTYGKFAVAGQSSLGVDQADYANVLGASGTVRIETAGSSTNPNLAFSTKGTGAVYFWRGGYGTTISAIIDGSGNVGIGTASPNASAILDAQSTTKGVRMPNMTTTQKNAISSPAAGLMVFDTTLAKLCVYSGSAWQTITSV